LIGRSDSGDHQSAKYIISRSIPIKSPVGLFKGLDAYTPLCLMNVTVLRTFDGNTNVFSIKVTGVLHLNLAAEPR